MNESTISIPTSDEVVLQTYVWQPEGQPTAAVQIHHGLAEHAGRYRRFAEALTAAGYLVYAPDARGSGRTAAPNYGNWGSAGWQGWVNDFAAVRSAIRDQHPHLPVALFAHSLGSFGAQQYLLDRSEDFDAVVLSGTGDPAALVPMLAGDGPSDLSMLNHGFEQRTGFEWLSRDESEVDAYVADEASGWSAPAPAGMEELLAVTDLGNARTRPDLPVLLISGDHDPVGQGGQGVNVVAQRLRDAGVQNVEVKLYPQARHELLNETNRDEVTADVIAFLDAALATSR